MNPVFAPVSRCGMLAIMGERMDAAGRWREIVRRQAGSGLSVAAFCRRAHISQASFYVWRRKLRDAGTFAEVRVACDHSLLKDGPSGQGTLELVLPGGRSIVVRPGFDRATLLALVDVLECGEADGVGEESGA